MKFWCALLFLSLLPFFAFADTTSTLRPVADGVDDSEEWKNTSVAECSAADCSLEVRETGSCDGNTSYIEGAANGENQTFDIDESGIPDNAVISSIAITVCYAQKTADTNSFQTRYCSDGSCANSGTAVDSSDTAYQETTQDHSGLSITKTASTDLEIGVSITGTSGEDIRISQISAAIIYTPPDTTVAQSGGGGSSGGGGGPRRAVFSGQAYPESEIEILRRSRLEKIYTRTPEESFNIDANGAFTFSYTGLIGDDYFFALRVKDKEGKSTGIVAFDAPLRGDLFEVKNILVSPTVSFKKSALFKGDVLKVHGYAGPGHMIELLLDGLKHEGIKADTSGYWSSDMDITYLPYGEHNVRVRQISPDGGTISSFSPTRIFKILQLIITEADLNGDGVVNIRDWSIFLFRWGSEDMSLRIKNDLNNDGEINVFDFSIFLQSIKI